MSNRILNKRTARFFIVLLFFLALLLITDYYGFAGTGFEDQNLVDTRNFYFNSAIVASIVILFGFLYTLALRKGDEKYGIGLGMASPGEKPHLPIFKRFTIPQLSWIFLIIFLLMGFVNFNGFFGQQTTYTGVGTLVEKQQFTQGQNLAYTTLLVPTAENLPLAAILILIILGLGYYARKQNWNYSTYFAILLVSSFILGGIYGYGMHKIVYSSSDISLMTVFGFWAIGSVISILTGLFVIFWEMHLVNNLFVGLSQILNPDLINLYTGLAFVLLTLGYFFVYRNRWIGQKSPETIDV